MSLLCESCQGAVPESLMQWESYTSAAASGKELKRNVCILCRFYLPRNYNDCYTAFDRQHELGARRTAIRNLWTAMLNIADMPFDVPLTAVRPPRINP